MPGSRVGLALVAATALIASGTGGVYAAHLVTGSMTPFYSGAEPPSPVDAPHVVAIEAPAPASPPEAFAPMPASYWSAAPALAAASADDSRRWERDADADARRWQAHIDAEVRAAQQQTGNADAAADASASDGPPADNPPATPAIDADPPPSS